MSCGDAIVPWGCFAISVSPHAVVVYSIFTTALFLTHFYVLLLLGNEHTTRISSRNVYIIERICYIVKTMRTFDSYTKYALSYHQYMKIMMVCRTTEQTCLIGLACELGLRRDDLVALEVTNIDIQNKRLTFFESKKNRIKMLPIPDQQVQDITKHLNTFKKPPKYLFPAKRTSKTGHMSGMEAWRILQELCLQADVPEPVGRKHRPFHALRGTCYKLKQNRDKWTIEQAAAWLGDTPETAMKHYGKTTDAELETLVRGL